MPSNQLEQPDSGHGPMPANRGLADVERVGDLLVLESDEVAQLHDLRLDGIFFGEGIERFVYQEEFFVLHRRCDPGLVQLHPFLVTAAFELAVAAGAVHEDSPHGLGRGTKEVRSILKLKLFRASQPKVGFIHQRGRLQRVARTLGSHFAGCYRPQFSKNQSIELIEGNGITTGRSSGGVSAHSWGVRIMRQDMRLEP